MERAIHYKSYCTSSSVNFKPHKMSICKRKFESAALSEVINLLPADFRAKLYIKGKDHSPYTV